MPTPLTTSEMLQQRPRRTPGCSVERQQIAAAAPAYILKDDTGRRYLKLSAEGFFLWQQIDGNRTIRDLCVAYVAHVARPAPQEALRALARLLDAGLVVAETRPDAPEVPERRRTVDRLASLATRYVSVTDVDRRVAALYRVLRLLYTPVVQAILLAVAGAGAIAFAWHAMAGISAPGGTLPHATLVWIACLAPHIVVHEAAHALTCKHFGRAVHRVGVGWYYFAPVAFVDTSDMWAAAKWPRVLVSAAGPYANLVLAGGAALAALVPAAHGARDALWSFSLIGFGLAAVNMNPLLELDGYYVLMDLCEIPNLRARALACLGARLRGRSVPAPAHGRALACFGLASLAYGLAMGVGVLVASRAAIGSLADAWLPASGAETLAWALAAGISLLIVYRLLDALRERPGATPRTE